MHTQTVFKAGSKVVILKGEFRGQTGTVTETGRHLSVHVHRSGAVVKAAPYMVRRER